MNTNSSSRPFFAFRRPNLLLTLITWNLAMIAGPLARSAEDAVKYVVIVNDYENPLLARALLALTYEDSGVIVNVGVGPGKTERITKKSIVKLIAVPDLTGDFVFPERFAQIKESLDGFSLLLETYPHFRAGLLPLGSELKTIVDSGARGFVREGGQWRQNGAMAAAPPGPAAPGPAPGPPATPGVIDGAWMPTTQEEVAECALFVKVLDKVGAEGKHAAGGGSAFLCNVDGVTYIYSNVHNFDGTREFSIIDQSGRKYEDFVSVEVAGEGQGYNEALGKGGDVIRIRLRDFHPRALSLTDRPISNEDVGKDILVTGNTQDRDVITKLTGKITGIESDRIIAINAKAQVGNSGSPIVDLATFRVIGIFTWGAYDDNDRDPLKVLWSKKPDELREGLGAGPDLAGMQFEATTFEALYNHRIVFNRMKQETRLLALLDTLYPRKEGVFVDTEQIVMGDYTVLDLIEESPDHPIVKELTELHERLKQKAKSNVGISNQDMFKAYISSYGRCLTEAAKLRSSVVESQLPTFYMECRFKNSRIIEIAQAYEAVLKHSIAWYEEQSGTRAEVWPIDKRIRLPVFRTGIDGSVQIKESLK